MNRVTTKVTSAQLVGPYPKARSLQKGKLCSRKRRILFMKDHFSSDEEFDRPIREYLEKTMARPQKKTEIRCTSTGTTAFAHEMDDELDQIYQNFLSRGTFQLPLASKSDLSPSPVMRNIRHAAFFLLRPAQKTPEETKPPVMEDAEGSESDDDGGVSSKASRRSHCL